MRSYLVLLFSFVAVIQFYGCDNGASSNDEPDPVPLVGELDSNNTGANIDVASADLDSLLSTLFSSFNVGGGIDFYYDIKNRLRNSSRDTSNWDTTITIDSLISGKSGVIDYLGKGLYSRIIKTEGSDITQYDSSEIEIREVYYNYSSDSILFFGGESICKELEKDTSFENDLFQYYRTKETEVCSLNLRFNGKYRGNLSGTLTYYQHENSDMVIDSSVTASLVLTSASTKIELTESDLADYLEF